LGMLVAKAGITKSEVGDGLKVGRLHGYASLGCRQFCHMVADENCDVLALVPEICEKGEKAFFKKLQLGIIASCLLLKALKKVRAQPKPPTTTSTSQPREAKEKAQYMRPYEEFNKSVKNITFKSDRDDKKPYTIQVVSFMEVMLMAALDGFKEHKQDREAFHRFWGGFKPKKKKRLDLPDSSLCIPKKMIDVNPEETAHAHSFPIGHPIGRGAYGEVKVGFFKTKGVKVAVKILKNRFDTDEDRLDVINEIKTNYLVKHNHCVSLLGVMVKEEEPGDPSSIWVVQELCEGGDLATMIKERPKHVQEYFWKFAEQLASALEHLHSQKIVHLDIKPENVLLTRGYSSCKFCDFGMGRKLENLEHMNQSLNRGTAQYMAPEFFLVDLQIRHYEMKKDTWDRPDIYSLAILYLQMYSAGVDIFEHYPDGPVAANGRWVQGEKARKGVKIEIGTIVERQSHRENRPFTGKIVEGCTFNNSYAIEYDDGTQDKSVPTKEIKLVGHRPLVCKHRCKCCGKLQDKNMPSCGRLYKNTTITCQKRVVVLKSDDKNAQKTQEYLRKLGEAFKEKRSRLAEELDIDKDVATYIGEKFAKLVKFDIAREGHAQGICMAPDGLERVKPALWSEPLEKLIREMWSAEARCRPNSKIVYNRILKIVNERKGSEKGERDKRRREDDSGHRNAPPPPLF